VVRHSDMEGRTCVPREGLLMALFWFCFFGLIWMWRQLGCGNPPIGESRWPSMNAVASPCGRGLVVDSCTKCPLHFVLARKRPRLIALCAKVCRCTRDQGILSAGYCGGHLWHDTRRHRQIGARVQRHYGSKYWSRHNCGDHGKESHY
jgi:hypothetical protein